MVNRPVCVIALLGLVTGGCATGMKPVPKSWQPSQRPECTTSAALPTVDLVSGIVIGVPGLVLLAGGIEGTDCSGDNECLYGDLDALAIAAGVVLGLVGTLYVISGAYGMSSRTRCLEAKQKHHEWITTHPTEAP